MIPNLLIPALVIFYSRIVLRKVPQVVLSQYRKVENDYKKLLKSNADTRYINSPILVILVVFAQITLGFQRSLHHDTRQKGAVKQFIYDKRYPHTR